VCIGRAADCLQWAPTVRAVLAGRTVCSKQSVFAMRRLCAAGRLCAVSPRSLVCEAAEKHAFDSINHYQFLSLIYFLFLFSLPLFSLFAHFRLFSFRPTRACSSPKLDVLSRELCGSAAQRLGGPKAVWASQIGSSWRSPAGDNKF